MRNQLKRDQHIHRDHHEGYGVVANLAIDLDDRALCTIFYKDWGDTDPVITHSSRLVFDSHTIHAGAGLERCPQLIDNRYRLFCSFANISHPQFDSMHYMTDRSREIYPPTLSDIKGKYYHLSSIDRPDAILRKYTYQTRAKKKGMEIEQMNRQTNVDVQTRCGSLR